MGKKGKGPIRAAGCVVYRTVDRTTNGGGMKGAVRHEVLLAHRPKYDDWDFPKGHLEKGETDLEAAIRETEEEVGATGTIMADLPEAHRKVKGRPKVTRWWLMRCDREGFEPNDEVDEVAWLDLEAAAERLSYDDSLTLLDDARAALERVTGNGIESGRAQGD